MTKVVYFQKEYPYILEKAINDYAENNEFDVVNIRLSKDFCHAMVVFKNELAEGRKELEQWKQEWQDAQIKANEEGFARTIIQIKYNELEKENAELSNSVLEFSNSVIELTNSKTELENKITELEKQIEKMKNCQNCKHCKITYDEETQTMYNCIPQKESECKWELAE